MFGRRCTLCNGKLDSRNICKECGLDNNKSEKNYRINQNLCDDMPLTHVHEEETQRPSITIGRTQKTARKKSVRQERTQKTYTAPIAAQTYTAAAKGKKKKPGCLIFVIFFIICIGISIISAVFAITDSFTDFGTSSYDEIEYEEMDPYEYVVDTLPEEGENVSYDLSSGIYVVGVHIAAGNYVADTNYEFDVVQVDDYHNSIYLYEYEGDDGTSYLEDLRLYPGAVVTISSETYVTLRSDNGQTQDLVNMENPLTETVVVYAGEMKRAGEDFQAGVYNVNVSQGYGSVDVIIYDADGNEYTHHYLYLGEDSSNGDSYKNLVIPEGATITCDSDIEIVLTPSETIGSTDYLEYYMYY